MSSDEELADVFVVDAGKGSVDLEDFNFEQTVRRKVGAVWGLMPETKEYLARHIMPWEPGIGIWVRGRHLEAWQKAVEVEHQCCPSLHCRPGLDAFLF